MPMSDSFKERLFPRLPEIVEKYGTPFHIYDCQGIIDGGLRMRNAFIGANHRQYFAVKALPDPVILLLLNKVLGFGFDCSSVPELTLARGVIEDKRMGENNIMFTSNNTSDEEFRAALSNGGCMLNLDDISLVAKVPDPFPGKISFRINPGKKRAGNSIIGNPYDAKFGITLDQVVPAYSAALERGASCLGMHTMLCSNELRPTYMVETVRMLLEQCLVIEKRLGRWCAFINMGGGFGIPYRPQQRELPLEWMATRITRLLKQFEVEHGWRPRLMTECGRYITGPHGVLVSRIINRMSKYREFLGVDTGMTALMRPAMYDAYHHVDILDPQGSPREGPRMRMSVVGSICEDCDRLATDRLLPKNATEGDLVVTHDTGAHGSAMGFNYNGRMRPQALLLFDDGRVTPLRRAETEKDLFATLIPPRDIALAA